VTLPRFSLDAEHSVVSSALLDPQSVFGGDLAISLQDYYNPRCRAILGAAKGILEEGGSVDVVSVAQRLIAEGTIESIGGTPELAKYFDLETPRGDPVRNARLVAELARLRRGVDLAKRLVGTSETCDDVRQWLSEACAGFLDLCQDSPGARVTTSTLDAMLADECNAVTARGSGAPCGKRTGLRALDRALKGGLDPGCVYVVAGRPGMGKTVLGWQIGEAVADDGHGVAFVSLEMTRANLARRVLCGQTGISREDFASGDLSAEQWRRIAEARARLGRLPIAVDDQPALDHRGERAAVQRCQRKLQVEKNFTGDLGVIVVDYLQLMTGSGDTREQDVARNSQGLCELAKLYACPVVALSQLNRSVENRQDRRPQLSDLRESGAIEQDATAVLMLYRPQYYESGKSESEGVEVAEILLRKFRNGPTGTIKVAFNGESSRFADLATPDDGFDDMFDGAAQYT
jgi:replicative DNA helicase